VIVLLAAAAFVLSILFGRVRGVVPQLIRRARLRAKLAAPA
jgi:hypothetical protein